MDGSFLMNIGGVSIDILVLMIYFTAADMPINQVISLLQLKAF